MEKWFELWGSIQCKEEDSYQFMDDLCDWMEANGHNWVSLQVSPVKEDKENGEESGTKEAPENGKARKVKPLGTPWKLVRREPSAKGGPQ